LKKFFFDFSNFPVKALRQESRRGQPGLRGDSRGIAVQNDKRCPRSAGLSALSHRDAETKSKAACENAIHLRYLVRVNPSGPMKQRKAMIVTAPINRSVSI
jgi:hypothetical protein